MAKMLMIDISTASAMMENMPSVISTATSVLKTLEKRSPMSVKYLKPMTVEVEVRATPTKRPWSSEK